MNYKLKTLFFFFLLKKYFNNMFPNMPVFPNGLFRPIDSQKSLLISLFPHSRHMLHPLHYPCYVLGRETTFVLFLISQGCQCRNFLNQGIVRRHIYFIYNKVNIQKIVYEKYGKFQRMIV